jgi:hypothetical protein
MSATTITIRSLLMTTTLPISKTRRGVSVPGYPSGSRPRQTRTKLDKKNDIPIALIRYARRGAPRRRSGRYATRSMPTAMAPDASMLGTRAAASSSAPWASLVTPIPGTIALKKMNPAKLPPMKTSECAKLMS